MERAVERRGQLGAGALPKLGSVLACPPGPSCAAPGAAGHNNPLPPPSPSRACATRAPVLQTEGSGPWVVVKEFGLRGGGGFESFPHPPRLPPAPRARVLPCGPKHTPVEPLHAPRILSKLSGETDKGEVADPRGRSGSLGGESRRKGFWVGASGAAWVQPGKGRREGKKGRGEREGKREGMTQWSQKFLGVRPLKVGGGRESFGSWSRKDRKPQGSFVRTRLTGENANPRPHRSPSPLVSS